MKTYLVTGGAGFIGINFVKFLLRENKRIKIIVLDKLTYASNIEALKDEIEKNKIIFYRGDINDTNFVEEIFQKHDIDYIVNFAAESHVDNSIENPTPFFTTNIMGTVNLLNIAKKYWEIKKSVYGEKKFLQISTDEVYGSLNLESENSFLEGDKLSPSSPYSSSKAAADLIVLSYFKTYNFPALISRTTNNFGEYQHTEKFIPASIKRLLNGEKIKIYGDGKNVRDWLYVIDNCRAIYKILNFGKIGEIYNVSASNEMSNNEVAKILIEKIKRTDNFYDYIEYVDDRAGHDRRYSLDSSKTQNELNWKKHISFVEGIEKTIKYFKK